MALDLFTPIVSDEEQHPIFQMILNEAYTPERSIITSWAEGFEDRDGKFITEFQKTFESSFWELYLHAALKDFGFEINLEHHAPDFAIESPTPFLLEATIAAPPAGGRPPIGATKEELPKDFTEFNIESTLRICNSFDSKLKKYRKSYSKLDHVKDKPFVIGIASFDRPHSHFAAGRSIMAALYGIYHDEAATKPTDERVPSYNVSAAPKNENTNIEVGLFCDDTYPEVSAVIYSCLATWGKVRALADNPDALTIYQTVHPREGSILPEVRSTTKKDYHEHLLDGLYVLHNPFATNPLPRGLLNHERICEVSVANDGELIMDAPDDFLLLRMLFSAIPK
ncbi:glycosaminoglycan attachment site [Pseudomonas sp. NPDC087029]|uniref:glycosaminoglycan attachment site n=1 Tax=Pseudomonas sp. NPDC087029 TaxID=3364433 RepID=UPI0037FACBC6